MAKLGLVVGQTYTVNWNGTEADYICKEMIGEGIRIGAGLGNVEAMSETGDSGDAFVILDVTKEGQSMVPFEAIVIDFTGATSATFSISGLIEKVYQLESKYVPNARIIVNGVVNADDMTIVPDKSFQEMLNNIKQGNDVILKITVYDDIGICYLSHYNDEIICFFRIITESSNLQIQKLEMLKENGYFTISN